MKKIIVLLLVAVMSLSMVACGTEDKDTEDKIQSEETAGGFVPNQVEENEEIAELAEEIITTEDLTQYYDATQYTGTPRLMRLKCIHAKLENETCLVMSNGNTLTIAYDERLKDLAEYDCILVDTNNTPDNDWDDTIVYIFMD